MFARRRSIDCGADGRKSSRADFPQEKSAAAHRPAVGGHDRIADGRAPVTALDRHGIEGFIALFVGSTDEGSILVQGLSHASLTAIPGPTSSSTGATDDQGVFIDVQKRPLA